MTASATMMGNLNIFLKERGGCERNDLAIYGLHMKAKYDRLRLDLGNAVEAFLRAWRSAAVASGLGCFAISPAAGGYPGG